MNSLRRRAWPGRAPARIANVVLFNLAWFAIVVTQSSLVALAILMLYLLAHFWFIARGRDELLLVVGVTLFGAIVDQVLFRAGVFTLAGQSALAPLWMTCLWALFATTLMHAFESLQGRVLLAALVGAAGGSLSYIAGVRLTTVEFGSPLWGPVVIGLLWALVFPLSLKISTSLGRRKDTLQALEPAARRAFD